MGLNRRNHPGHKILATEQANRFRLEARPRTGTALAQQLAIEAGVLSKTLGNGQDDLSMRDGRTNLFGNVDGGQARQIRRLWITWTIEWQRSEAWLSHKQHVDNQPPGRNIGKIEKIEPVYIEACDWRCSG